MRIWEGLGRMGRMGQSWGIQSGMLQACGCWLAPWKRYTERKPRTTLRQGTDVGYNRVITPTPFAITGMYMYCMRKTVGVGEGRERGGRGVSCYAFCLFCEYLVVHHPQLLVLPTFYTGWALGEIVSRCPTCSGSAATGKPHRRW